VTLGLQMDTQRRRADAHTKARHGLKFFVWLPRVNDIARRRYRAMTIDIAHGGI